MPSTDEDSGIAKRLIERVDEGEVAIAYPEAYFDALIFKKLV